jgi:hypothetical protein
MTIDSKETTMSQTIEHDPTPEPPFLADDLEPAGPGAGDELPRRPRRRLVTPVTGGLVAIIVAAAGFAGGVELQKAQASTGATAAPAGIAAAGGPRAFGAGFGGGAGPGAGAGGGATTGTVSYVKGNTLYVKGADGTTVKVKVTAGAKVTRTASTSASKVHPGDTVVVQGTKNGSGTTVTASTVTATATTSGN